MRTKIGLFLVIIVAFIAVTTLVVGTILVVIYSTQPRPTADFWVHHSWARTAINWGPMAFLIVNLLAIVASGLLIPWRWEGVRKLFK